MGGTGSGTLLNHGADMCHDRPPTNNLNFGVIIQKSENPQPPLNRWRGHLFFGMISTSWNQPEAWCISPFCGLQPRSVICSKWPTSDDWWRWVTDADCRLGCNLTDIFSVHQPQSQWDLLDVFHRPRRHKRYSCMGCSRRGSSEVIGRSETSQIGWAW